MGESLTSGEEKKKEKQRRREKPGKEKG